MNDTAFHKPASHKLSNAFEGALAGGGDPASSPLYVFGPFLKLAKGFALDIPKDLQVGGCPQKCGWR
jgi:hypothetical protein